MALVLSDYDIEGIYHISGIKHEVPDCLSRFPTSAYNPEEDDLQEIPLLTLGRSQVAEAQDADPQLKAIKDSIKNDSCPRNHRKYALINNVLHYTNPRTGHQTFVVPLSLRRAVLSEGHDDPLSGHLGFHKTYHKISARYYWPRIRHDIFHHVNSCHHCQVRKIPRAKPSGLMQSIEVPERPFSRVQIDVMGPFTRSGKQNKYVVTCIDYLSKYIEIRPIKEATTETVALFFLEQIVCRHGCPDIVMSDRGTTFTSELFQELNKQLGIDHRTSTAYHPQTQGLVERSHSTLTDCIAIYAASNQKDWCSLIPHLQFAINSSVQETTGYSPHYLLHGQEPTLPLEAQLGITKHVALDEILGRMEEARRIARQNILVKQEKDAERVNS
jgi:transposase InsO family protein